MTATPPASPHPPESGADPLLVDHAEWQGLLSRVPDAVRLEVAAIVQRHVHSLASAFYDTLLREERARQFLSHDVVAQRLHGSMQRWLATMFSATLPDVAAVVQLQQHVGQVHARIQLPITLVSRGARILKDAISVHLRRSPLNREQLSLAQQYVGGTFDLALEVMSTAYLRDARRDVRAGEAYRLFSLGQNVAAERERQRAALLDWSRHVLLQMHLAPEQHSLPTLRRAEFGLWMYHKGGASFEGSDELSTIWAAMGRLDDVIVPRMLQAAQRANASEISRLAQRFTDEVEQIQFVLNRLFERMGEIESGRDPLTQLLNRRFVPTVLAREIALARQEQGRFALLMLDLDHFKQINDSHGHDGGDAVLRQVAELLLGACRSGDYVFRYGGEEFLIVLVDLDRHQLAAMADKIRRAIADHRFRLPNGQKISVTTSVGGASFDGHPDPQHLIQTTDQRLYQAKQAGRNRSVLG